MLYQVYGNLPAGLESGVAMVTTLYRACPVAWAGKKHCSMDLTRSSASAKDTLTGPAVNNTSNIGTPGAENRSPTDRMVLYAKRPKILNTKVSNKMA